MSKLPVVVMISGSGTNLQQIIDECHRETIEIKLVVSDQKEAFGVKRALLAGIPTIVHEQEKGQSRESYCESLIDVVESASPKLVILAGFMKILTPNFVNSFTIVNIHPALLPKFPGLHTHRRVLEAGDKEHGITIHFVDEGVDTGPIIHQVSMPILPDDTEETVEERIHQLEYYHYPRVIDHLARNTHMLQR